MATQTLSLPLLRLSATLWGHDSEAKDGGLWVVQQLPKPSETYVKVSKNLFSALSSVLLIRFQRDCDFENIYKPLPHAPSWGCLGRSKESRLSWSRLWTPSIYGPDWGLLRDTWNWATVSSHPSINNTCQLEAELYFCTLSGFSATKFKRPLNF